MHYMRKTKSPERFVKYVFKRNTVYPDRNDFFTKFAFSTNAFFA